MNCYHCQRPVDPNSAACPHCNAPFQQAPPQQSQPPSIQDQSPFKAPAYSGVKPHPPANETGDATGGVIPYKNPKALVAYYLGILSGLPLVGFPLGIAAFVLGIMGLRARSRNPAIKGSIHAGIGIGCGGLFAVLWGIGIVAIIIALINSPPGR